MSCWKFHSDPDTENGIRAKAPNLSLSALSSQAVLILNFLGQRCYINSNKSFKEFSKIGCYKLYSSLFPFPNPHPMISVLGKCK
jgi:hypothetical protein